MKKLLYMLIVLLFAFNSWAADQNIYLDNAGTGAGSIGDPYGAFSEINWTTGGANSIFDWVGAGDDVFLYGQGASRGQVHITRRSDICATTNTVNRQVNVGQDGVGKVHLAQTAVRGALLGLGVEGVVNTGPVVGVPLHHVEQTHVREVDVLEVSMLGTGLLHHHLAIALHEGASDYVGAIGAERLDILG